MQWKGDGAANFLNSWEVLSERTEGRVRLAVDESLTETAVNLEHLARCNKHNNKHKNY